MVSVDIGLLEAAAFSDSTLRIFKNAIWGDVQHQTSQTSCRGNGRLDLRPVKSDSIQLSEVSGRRE